MNPNPYPGMGHMPLFFAPFFMLFAIVAFAIYLIPFWMIFKKAGFSPWLALLTWIPLVGIIVFYVVAFSQWNVVPVTRTYPAVPPPAPGYPPTV